MALQVAVTIPPHRTPGVISIGSEQDPVDEMERLGNYRLEIATFTPEVAVQVEDILLREGYTVTSKWEYLIEFCAANVEPLRGTNA